MNETELKQAVKVLQSLLDDDLFLVVEKDCIEMYSKGAGYIPTPCINEDYVKSP